MRIVVPHDMDETRRRLERGIRIESGPVVFCMPLLLKSELRGNVKGNTFWLQCTRPHMANIPQRYFSGTLEQDDDHTIIEGKFKYSGFHKGLFLAMFVFFLLLPSRIAQWVMPLGCASVALLLMGLGSVFYEQEEKAVIAYLNKLQI